MTSYKQIVFGAGNHPAASANQNVAINIPRENSDEWTPCFPHKLKHTNGAKDSLIPNETSKI